MPYDSQNKQIYIDVTTTPRTGVSINDVRTALNESSYDLGTLCKSSRINPWAKYKPVEYNTWGLTGKTSGVEYWRGNDGQCGLEIPKDNWSDRFLLFGNSTAWTRVKPTTKFRLLDFDGYNGNSASAPTGTLTEAGQSALLFERGVPFFHVDLATQSTLSQNDFLTMNDLKIRSGNQSYDLKDAYLRFLISSTDAPTVTAELETDAKVYDSSYSTTQMKELTMGALVDPNSGITRVTFSTYYEFTVNVSSNGPVPGSVYHIGSNTFQIQKVTKSGNAVTKLFGFKTGGTDYTPATGTLTKDSGTGASSVSYTGLFVNSITFGGRSYYILPVLYHPTAGVVCSLGYNPSQMTLTGITGVVEVTGISITKNGHDTFEVTLDVSNGTRNSMTVSLNNIKLLGGSSYADITGNNPYTITKSSVSDTVAAVSSTQLVFTISDARLTSTYPYTGIEFTIGGTTDTGTHTEIFDNNEEPANI